MQFHVSYRNRLDEELGSDTKTGSSLQDILKQISHPATSHPFPHGTTQVNVAELVPNSEEKGDESDVENADGIESEEDEEEIEGSE